MNLDFKSCLTQLSRLKNKSEKEVKQDFKIKIIGDSRMRQVALSLDAFYRRNFTDLVDTVGHYQFDVAGGGVKFYWVPTFEGFLGNLKRSTDSNLVSTDTDTESEVIDLDLINSDFVILSPFIMHRLVVPTVEGLDPQVSRENTNRTLEELVSAWPELLLKLEKNYPKTNILIINNEDSKMLAPDDDGCYYCSYWTARINKIFEDFYMSRLIPFIDDHGNQGKVYRSNVHIYRIVLGQFTTHIIKIAGLC